jgi:hypothetical protein
MALVGSTLNLLSSPEPQDNIGVMGWSNGTPLGTGTVIDFGNNLTATLSGTVLRLNAQAGGGGGGGGVVAWDDGVYRGTGTIIDFRNNLTVGFSGTVITVDGSGGSANPPITGSIVFRDPDDNTYASVLRVDVTNGDIHFSVSGTVGNLNITGSTVLLAGVNGDALVRITGSTRGFNWVNQDYNIQFHLGDGTNTISTGSTSAGYAYVEVPMDSVAESWGVYGDATGSMVTNVFRSTYAGFPPATPLAGLGQPVLSGQRINQNNATGTASVAKGDMLLLSVSSVSTLKLATVSLRMRKTATS